MTRRKSKRSSRLMNLKDLHILVDAEVMSRVNARLPFTAYAITQVLREANPGLDIVHREVRVRVRDLMGSLDFAQHPYQLEWRTYYGIPARTYVPCDVIQTPVTDSQTPGTQIDWSA